MTPLSKLETITLIERSQIDKVVKEIDFNQSKYVDPRYAVELGELLGVDLSVMGSLQQFGSRIRISVRMISAETGEILESDHVGGFIDDLFSLQDKAGTLLAEKLQ